MANGKAHFTAYQRASFTPIVLAGVLLFIRPDWWLASFGILLGYFLVSRYLTPDIDLVGITSEESRAMREWHLIGVAWTMYWMPYAFLMRFVGLGRKGHRNFFSHVPLISTAIRYAYLVFPWTGLAVVVAQYFSWTLPPFNWQLMGGAIAGSTILDTLHFVQDIFDKERNP